MTTLELFNNLLKMEKEERVIYVKKLPTDRIESLKQLMDLSPLTSIKRLCQNIEDTALFIHDMGHL